MSMKNYKVLVVKFATAHPTYGFSSIKVGAANIEKIEMAESGVLVSRKGGQLLFHPFAGILGIELEVEPEILAPVAVKKPSSKD
jgi:hypothetical protein